jgi:hypothetical protein
MGLSNGICQYAERGAAGGKRDLLPGQKIDFHLGEEIVDLFHGFMVRNGRGTVADRLPLLLGI